MSQLTTQSENAQREVELKGNTFNQHLTFSVKDERFAIGILDVQEIIEVNCLAHVPMTPDYISGVINLRGNVVPVVDLAARLRGECAVISDRSCIVVVELHIGSHIQVLGMLVDTVDEILEIQSGDIHAPPDFGTDINTDFIKHMGWVGDGFIILLHVDHLLSVGELASLDQLQEMREKHA